MRRILFIVAMCVPVMMQAQSAKKVTPAKTTAPKPAAPKTPEIVHFPDAEGKGPDVFNAFLLSIATGYHVVYADSSSLSTWSYEYRNAERERLEMTYNFKMFGENPNLKTAGTRGIERVEITVQFLLFAKMYNAIFGKDTPPDVLEKQLKSNDRLTAKYKDVSFTFIGREAGGSEKGRWEMLFEREVY